MSRSAQPDASAAPPYHRGDLRDALVSTSLELISERGVRGFSMAQVTRRLGVAPSAPYAHFTNREALLAEIAARGCASFARQLTEITGSPLSRLAEYVARFVTFAAQQTATFEVLYQAGLDKRQHAHLRNAEARISEVFETTLAELNPRYPNVGDLSAAIEATAVGHAVQLLDSRNAGDSEDADLAAARAAHAVRALLAGWITP